MPGSVTNYWNGVGHVIEQSCDGESQTDCRHEVGPSQSAQSVLVKQAERGLEDPAGTRGGGVTREQTDSWRLDSETSLWWTSSYPVYILQGGS